LTSAVVIFFQGLLFLLLLHIIGHPFVSIALRRSGIPSKIANLDFIQRLPIEFVTGGAVIYVVALITTPVQGFTALACWIVTGIATALYLFQHLKGIASFRRPSSYSWLAFAVFVITLAIRVGPVSNFVLGSNQDISWHTLLTYSVIRNGGIPFSVIEGFILQVPVATHTVLAYFSFMSGIPPEFVTFYSLVFFGAIVGLAAYFFGSIMHSQKFGLYISIVMISFSYYPSAITWGSPWLVLGLLTFFVAAALIMSFSTENLKLDRSGILLTLFPGVVTGFLASTYTPLYILLLPTSFFIILLGKRDLLHRLKVLAIIFMLGVPLFAIWIYRFAFLSQPNPPFIAQQAATMMYNQAAERTYLFLPIRDFSSPNVIVRTVRNWLTWDYQNGWPGSIFFFWLLVMGCILMGCILLWRGLSKNRARSFEHLAPRYVASIILVTILWGLNGPLGLFYNTSFGLGIMISELDKIAPIMGTILLPLIAAFTLVSIDNWFRALPRIDRVLVDLTIRVAGAVRSTTLKNILTVVRKLEGLLENKLPRAVISKRTKVRAWVSVCVILLVISPSLAIAPLTEAWLVGSYRIFATATESDYELLKWMRSEIPSNSNVLVNTEDAGQYVQSIGGQKAVYFGSAGVKALNESYHILHNQITDKIFDSSTIELFRDLKIDYVFLGGQGILLGGWDPVYFLTKPWYFRLVHSIGRSGLFAVKTQGNNVSTGFISSRDYLGFSSNQTSIDLYYMGIQDLATSEFVSIEIGLNDETGKTLEWMNYWSYFGGNVENRTYLIRASAIDLAGNTNFTLISLRSKYVFHLTMSLTGTNSININISAENAPPQSTIYFSYFPIYNVIQPGVNFTTDQITSSLLSSEFPVQGIRNDTATLFELVPHRGQVVTTWTDPVPGGSGGHVSVRSVASLNVTILTRQLDKKYVVYT
jgi:hypothetical protein